MTTDVASNLKLVRERMRAACLEAGRKPEEVTLVAVSKRQDRNLVQLAIEAGQVDFGENQVQSMLQRIEDFGTEKIRWHLIGSLQSKKGKQAIAASCLHGIGSLKAANAVAKALAKEERTVPLPILLQVNISREESKSGLASDEVEGVLTAMRELPLLDIRGLMCIPERGAGRLGFAKLRSLRDQLRSSTGLALDDLSMGMSGDYEDAILEGSTMVRVGQAIFGERQQPPTKARVGTAGATLAALAMMVGACGGTRESKTPRGKPSDKVIEEPTTRVPSAAIRRLSIQEFRNTLRTLTGTVPMALEQLPPDSLGHSYDRVVNSQTMSPAHVDAYLAIAAETTDALLNTRRLDELSPACKDSSMPPARQDEAILIKGNALSIDPDWSVVPATRPKYSKTRYAPNPTIAYTHQFDATGSYRMEFSFIANSNVDLEVLVDGRSITKKSGLRGRQKIASSLLVKEARGHALEFKFSTSPPFHNLEISYQQISIAGPRDTKAKRHKGKRAACAKGLIADFAPRAYRRNLTKDESASLQAIYTKVASRDGAIGGLRTLLQTILTSPHFLHLVEVGSEVPGSPGLFKLSSREMASRLSYAICEEPPDAELRDAARRDKLETKKQIVAQARRLFALPCAETTVLRFFEHWLWLNRLPTLNKSPEAFPLYTTDVREGMHTEARRYLREMVLGKADLRELLSSNYSWPDPRSAFLYGKRGLAVNKKAKLPNERAGVLTLPAVLAVTSTFDSTSPVKRGIFVLDQLLCDKPPSPPAEFDITPPLPDPSATTRERWAFHTGPNACASCHLSIDPIGFAFEEFDSIGRHRKKENGLPVDAKGGIPSIGVADGSLRGAAPVAKLLANSPDVANCLSRQWLRFSLGRLETPDDKATIDMQTMAFQNKSLHKALLSMIGSEAFAHRRQAEASDE